MLFHYVAQLKLHTRIHLKCWLFKDEIRTSNFWFANKEQADAKVLHQWMGNFFNRLYQMLKGDTKIQPEYKSQY